MPLAIASESVKNQSSLKIGRVLVVEDEELICETIALALADEGYEVLTATDGRSALDLIHQLDEPDLGHGTKPILSVSHAPPSHRFDKRVLRVCSR